MKTLLIAILFIVGCGPGNSPDWLCEDCNNRIDEMENEMGVPDDELVLRGERDNYWSATYWYWQAGISYTFVQSGCVCDESTLTFTPVLESSEIETSWKHQSNPYTGQGSYSIAFSKGVLLVRLMLKLTGDPVSEELLAQYEKGIEDTWSTDRFSVPIVVDVVWTDDDPDKVINVVSGVGRWHTSQWHTDGEIEEIVAHEAGHYFGLYDEYGGGDAQGFDGGAAPGPRPPHMRGLMSNHNMPVLDYYYDGFMAWLMEVENGISKEGSQGRK